MWSDFKRKSLRHAFFVKVYQKIGHFLQCKFHSVKFLFSLSLFLKFFSTLIKYHIKAIKIGGPQTCFLVKCFEISLTPTRVN